jgi:hypothetical protein
MIQTILLTVLFTIFGVGMIVFLIWLMVTSWNAKKLSKANSEDITNLYTNLPNEVSEIYRNYDEKLKELYTYMDSRFSDVHQNYDAQIKDVYSKMDRRFDKSLSKLITDFGMDVDFDEKSIKHKVPVPPDVWIPTENPESSEKSWNLTEQK